LNLLKYIFEIKLRADKHIVKLEENINYQRGFKPPKAPFLRLFALNIL